MMDQFYGDRSGTVIDPFGHVWTLATHIEDVSVEEMQRVVTQLRERMYAPGDVVAGWNRGGADPDGVLRAAGADRFYYLIHRTGGDSVAILTDRPFASVAPSGCPIRRSIKARPRSSAIVISSVLLQYATRFQLGKRTRVRSQNAPPWLHRPPRRIRCSCSTVRT